MLPDPPPPCRFCHHDTFAALERVNIEWFVSGSRSGDREFLGPALVCMNCGHVDLFVGNVQRWLHQGLDAGDWKMVQAAPPGPPYR